MRSSQRGPESVPRSNGTTYKQHDNGGLEASDMKMGSGCGPGSFDTLITGHDVQVPSLCSLEGTKGISHVALRIPGGFTASQGEES